MNLCDNCGEHEAFDDFGFEYGTFCCEECGEEYNEDADDEYDGQPDEMQEWHDFDPDC